MARLFAGTPWDRQPTCDRWAVLESECACPPLDPEVKRTPPEEQTARLMTERRAKGKLVTVIAGLAPEDNDLNDLATRLKNACGAGGTVKDGQIELQGDHLQCRRTRDSRQLAIRRRPRAHDPACRLEATGLDSYSLTGDRPGLMVCGRPCLDIRVRRNRIGCKRCEGQICGKDRAKLVEMVAATDVFRNAHAIHHGRLVGAVPVGDHEYRDTPCLYGRHPE